MARLFCSQAKLERGIALRAAKKICSLFFLHWGQNDANLLCFSYKIVSKLDSGAAKILWRAAVWPPLVYTNKKILIVEGLEKHLHISAVILNKFVKVIFGNLLLEDLWFLKVYPRFYFTLAALDVWPILADWQPDFGESLVFIF